MNIKPGTKDLDGVASIEIQNEKVLCAVHEAGLSFKGLTIKNAAVKMIERLNRSIKTTAPDPTESWLLGVCTGIALLCFVMWRRANVPMCALGMVLIAASGVFASDIEVNAMVRDAADIAEAKDFDTSQKMVEALLTTVANPQARGRLLYDRALLSYLQGNDTDALLWLNMEPSQEQPLAEAGTFEGWRSHALWQQVRLRKNRFNTKNSFESGWREVAGRTRGCGGSVDSAFFSICPCDKHGSCSTNVTLA